MYITQVNFESVDWDKYLKPVIAQHEKLCEENNVKFLGSGTPLGSFDNACFVHTTDLDPKDYMDFQSKIFEYEGMSLGTTSTSVVIRNR